MTKLRSEAPLRAFAVVASMTVLWLPALCVGIEWLVGRTRRRRANENLV